MTCRMQRNEILEALAKKKREYARLKKKLERSARAAHVKEYVQKKVDELAAKPRSQGPVTGNDKDHVQKKVDELAAKPLSQGQVTGNDKDHVQKKVDELAAKPLSQGQVTGNDKDHVQQSSIHQHLEASILSHTEQQDSILQCSLHDQSSLSTAPDSDTKNSSLDQTEKCKSQSFNSESRISTRNLIGLNDNFGINKGNDQCREQTQPYRSFSATVGQEFPNGYDKNTKHHCNTSMRTDVDNAHGADRRCDERNDSQCTDKKSHAMEISVPASSQYIDSFHSTQEGAKLVHALNLVLTSFAPCQKDNLKIIDSDTVHVASRPSVSAFAKSPRSSILRENQDCTQETELNESKIINSKDFLHSDCAATRICSNLADGNRIDIEEAKDMLLNASQKAGLDKCGILTKISCSQLSLCEYGIMDTDFCQSSVFLESQAAESEDLLVEPLQTRRKGRKRKNIDLQQRRTSQRLALKESSQGSSQTSDHSLVTSWSQDSQSSSGTNYPIVLPTCSQGLSQGVISLTQKNHPQPSSFPKLSFHKIQNKDDISFSLPEKEFGSLMREKIDLCKCDPPDTESMENSEIDCHYIPTAALSSDKKVQIQGISKENKKCQINMAPTIPWILSRKMSSNSDMSPALISTPDDSVQRMCSVSLDEYAARAFPAGIATVLKETDASCDHLLEPPVSESGKSEMKYLGSLKFRLNDIQHLLYGSKGGNHQSEILCCVSRSRTQLWSASKTHLWKLSAEWTMSQSLSIVRAHLLSCSDIVVLLLVCVDEESVSVKLLITYDQPHGSSRSINIALDITMHDRVSSCCLSENQFVVGVSCNNCTRVNKYSIKETSHELENKSELQSVDCDLHSLSTVQGQLSALLGTSSKCILIWNHDVGHLLMSIPMPDALSPFTCVSPIFTEKGYIFLPLLYNSLGSTAGCMLACNPSKRRTKVLFQYDVPPNVKPWSGVKDGGMSGEVLFAIDSQHTLYIWDVFSGRLQYRRDNIRTVAINNRHIVTASTTGCVHIHGR